VNRTIATLAAVGALTLAACGSGTSDTTTTTEDTRGWSEEAFRDVVTYCEARNSGACATYIIDLRDDGRCSIEAAYLLLDEIDNVRGRDNRTRSQMALIRDQLHPVGDCLGYK